METTTSSRRQTVFLHVGAPKTGTTYLQNVLWKNRETLAGEGVCYPLGHAFEHFPAALDLRGMPWGGRRDPQWEGAWDWIAQRARTWAGPTVVISNELLGGATEGQARRAVDSLYPAEVHVVFTARDLARQLPSDWQEHMKHQHTVPHEQFVDDLIEFGMAAPHPFGAMFWGLHDPCKVLGTWGSVVPRERVHLVTVPQAGAAPGALWGRFAQTIGIDPARYDTAGVKRNTSMGAVETELLRWVNVALGDRLGGDYDPLVRVFLAENVLASRPEPKPIVLSRRHHCWVSKHSGTVVANLRTAGYDVVGDLDELLPAPLPDEGELPRPEDATAPELLDAAIDSLVGLLDRLAANRHRERELRARIQELEHDVTHRLPALEQDLATRRRQPVRTIVRDLSEKRPAVMRARVAWWHTVEQFRRRRARG